MATKIATMFINAHKTTVRVTQLPLSRNHEGSSRDYLVSTEQGRLLFKISARRFSDGSFCAQAMEIVGSSVENYAVLSYIGFYQDQASAFEAGMLRTFERIVSPDNSFSMCEHCDNLRKLMRGCKSQIQFEVALRVRGYLDAPTKQDPVRRNLDEEEDSMGTFYEVTPANSRIKFALLVDYSSGTVSII